MRLGYRHYLLFVLLVILAFNGIDRLALGLVLQNIKVDLNLSDTQLGILTGIAFSLFYSIMGIPIARWADLGNRVAIISVTAALWSVMVALCGAAGNFLQLLLIRTGVAVGEAGCMPPAHSLIADNFSRAERPKAVATYMLGLPLSAVIGYFLAGWLNEIYGWRVTFMWLGLPGLILAPLAWFTLREPRRTRAAVASRAGSAEQPHVEHSALPIANANLREVCVTLWANVTFRRLLLCFSVAAFFSAGMMQWKPAFFIRSYGLKTGELGAWFTLIYGLGGLLGTYIGGELASRLAVHNERLQLAVMGVVYSSLGLVSVCIYLSSDQYLAFALMAVVAIGTASINGPLFATIQTLVPPRMRAVAIAILYLCANLIGLGLGPVAAGALSDLLRPRFGDESLRYALLALCPGYLWAGWYLWRASRTVAGDLEAIRNDQGGALRRPQVAMTSSMEH